MYLDKNELTVLVFFVTEHKLLVQSEEYSDGEVYIYIYTIVLLSYCDTSFPSCVPKEELVIIVGDD